MTCHDRLENAGEDVLYLTPGMPESLLGMAQDFLLLASAPVYARNWRLMRDDRVESGVDGRDESGMDGHVESGVAGRVEIAAGC